MPEHFRILAADFAGPQPMDRSRVELTGHLLKLLDLVRQADPM